VRNYFRKIGAGSHYYIKICDAVNASCPLVVTISGEMNPAMIQWLDRYCTVRCHNFGKYGADVHHVFVQWEAVVHFLYRLYSNKLNAETHQSQ
jgi:hypothetical protein